MQIALFKLFILKLYILLHKNSIIKVRFDRYESCANLIYTSITTNRFNIYFIQILYRTYIERKGMSMVQELFKRYELKYILTRDKYHKIREAILPRMPYDTYGSYDGKYNIVSLYYESNEKKIYYETTNKLRFRQKLRLRVYDQVDRTGNALLK